MMNPVYSLEAGLFTSCLGPNLNQKGCLNCVSSNSSLKSATVPDFIIFKVAIYIDYCRKLYNTCAKYPE